MISLRVNLSSIVMIDVGEIISFLSVFSCYLLHSSSSRHLLETRHFLVSAVSIQHGYLLV